MAWNMTTDVSRNRVLSFQSSGITEINSLAVSTVNFGACMFFVAIGVVQATGTGTIKVQGSDDNSIWVDLIGTGQSYNDTNGAMFFTLDVVRPTYAYLRLNITRATLGSSIYGAWSHSYLPRRKPAVSVVGQAGAELHLSPAAGTA